MSTGRQEQVRAIFLAAAEREPSARAAFLEEIVPNDPELRDEIQSLLAADAELKGFLSKPLRDVAAPVDNVLAGLPTMSETGSKIRPRIRLLPIRGITPLSWMALLVGLFVGISVYSYTIWIFCRYDTVEKVFGWKANRERHGWIITEVTEQAAQKLQKGDIILAFNGDGRAKNMGPGIYRFFLAPGDSYSMIVLRDAQRKQVSLSVARGVTPTHILPLISYLCVSLGFLMMAMLMGIAKPRHAVARIGYVAGLILAIRYAALPLRPFYPVITFERVISDVIWFHSPWHLGLGYHFFQRFFSRVLKERFWVTITFALYGLCGMFFALDQAYTIVEWHGSQAVISLLYRNLAWVNLRAFLMWGWPWNALESLGCLSIIAIIAVSWRRVTVPDQRRRLRWITLGFAVPLAFVCLSTLGDMAFALSGRPDLIKNPIWFNSGEVANIFVILVPTTIAYAVVAHKALGIHVGIRRSIACIMKSSFLTALLMFLPLAAALLLMPEKRSVPNLIVISLLLLVFCMLIGYRSYLPRWLERIFFLGEKQENMLVDLPVRLQRVDSVGEIAELVTTEIARTFRPQHVDILLWDKRQDDIVCKHSVLYDHGQSLAYGSLDFLHDDDRAAESRTDAASEQFRSDVITPIGNSHYAGLLLVGLRISGEAYTDRDRQVLDSIGAQLGMAVQSCWRGERLVQERHFSRVMRVRLEQQGVELVRECPSATCGRCFGSNLERCPKCNSELTTPIPVERVLAGRYRLKRHIGTGGIGRVYLAIDQQDGTKVAVKVCSVNLFGNPVVVSAFNREAVCLAQLNHENIVRIRDFGVTGGGGVFIVMDFIEGSTWLARLKQTGPVPPATAALWFDQLLSALAAAHDSGIVHGDLKPSNVIVGSQATGREQITLLDFGIGKILGIGEELDANRRVSGTWQYMSPERRRGADVSPEDDIFAVGVMLVEMLTGANPAATVGPLQVQAFLAEQFLFPMRYAGKCKALCEISQKCVSAEPNQRFRSATELRAEVIPVLASCHPVATAQVQ